MPPLDTVTAAPAPTEPAPTTENDEPVTLPPANAISTTAQASETNNANRRPAPFGIQKRVKDWIRILHRDPTEEARVSFERRARLLDEINRAVADAPDDIPIKDLVAQLNRHHDD